MNKTGEFGGCLLQMLIPLIMLAGWGNHLFVCFTEGRWGFLIAGALFFPIGIIHGWGLWFGWW